ncbi:MAG: hypothetical protein Q4F67_04400, partial [Propionibacteriaceae bacterium]|nr:hypothetical protein [Propionibacteriaceae bacterium]
AAPAAPTNPPVTTDPLPAPAPAPTGPLGRRLVGRWAGPVTGDATSYSVEVSISNGDPVAGVVRYPELPCSGTWAESSGVSNASGVYVTETITQGTDRCIAQVQLLLVPEGNTVRMHIFTTRTGHRPEAVLSRR